MGGVSKKGVSVWVTVEGERREKTVGRPVRSVWLSYLVEGTKWPLDSNKNLTALHTYVFIPLLCDEYF